MSSKSFKGGFDSLLGDTSTPAQEPEKKVQNPPTPISSAKIGTLEGETRATFIVRDDLLQKLKALAYWDRMKIKDAVNEAIELYVDQKGESHVKKACKEFEKVAS